MLDHETFLALNYNLIQKKVDFYRYIKTYYNILDKNICNIDKNSYIIGIIESSKVVFSKY